MGVLGRELDLSVVIFPLLRVREQLPGIVQEDAHLLTRLEEQALAAPHHLGQPHRDDTACQQKETCSVP